MVIDRVLGAGRYKSRDMLKVLRSGSEWDWSVKGDFAGLGGRGGAAKIRDKVVAELHDESGVSVKDLARRIIGG